VLTVIFHILDLFSYSPGLRVLSTIGYTQDAHI
jgi:hypothetical protein